MQKKQGNFDKLHKREKRENVKGGESEDDPKNDRKTKKKR